MSNVNRILKAVTKLGLATYTDLEAETGLPRDKLRWACNDLKATKRLKQTDDPTTNEIAFRITELGQQHLANNAQNNVSTQAGSGDITPAAAHRPSRVAGGTKRTEPPAEGVAPVIEAAKREKKPSEPASDKALDIAVRNHNLITAIRNELFLPDDCPNKDIPDIVADLRTKANRAWAKEGPAGDQLEGLFIWFSDLIAAPLAGDVETFKALVEREFDSFKKEIDTLRSEKTRGKTIHIAACPFCGYDDVEIEEIGHDEFAITCPECKAIGPSQSSTMASISGWNERKTA